MSSLVFASASKSNLNQIKQSSSEGRPVKSFTMLTLYEMHIWNVKCFRSVFTRSSLALTGLCEGVGWWPCRVHNRNLAAGGWNVANWRSVTWRKADRTYSWGLKPVTLWEYWLTANCVFVWGVGDGDYVDWDLFKGKRRDSGRTVSLFNNCEKSRKAIRATD